MLNSGETSYEQRILIQVLEGEMPLGRRKYLMQGDKVDRHSFPIEHVSMQYNGLVMRCAFLVGDDSLEKEDYLPVPNLSIGDFPDHIAFSRISKGCNICHEAATIPDFLASYFSKGEGCIHASSMCTSKVNNVLGGGLHKIEISRNGSFIGSNGMNLALLVAYRGVLRIASPIN